MDTKLDRLEAIQNAINHGVIRLQIYRDNYEMARSVDSISLMGKYYKDCKDMRRGLDRLRIAFDKELNLLRYNKE